MTAPALAAQSAADVGERVDEIVAARLRPQAQAIDRDGVYARDVMRALGEAGMFAGLAAGRSGLVEQASLVPTIAGIASVARICGATAFCCWCQGALSWYLNCTTNQTLRERLLREVASGRVLGGTALSNPMKNASGLESLFLKSGSALDGDGWLVSGVIPWVSNVESGHPFGIVFENPGAPPVMAVVDDGLAGLGLKPNDDFEVMAGTATVAARFDEVHVGADRVLGLDGRSFIEKVRAGFVLIQAGIGIGLLEAAADVMDATRREPSQGLEGGMLATSSSVFEAAQDFRLRAFAQAERAAAGDGPSFADVMRLRLELAEKVVRAATAAQLMAGAAGLRRGRRAIRLVREAAFFGVLTPSVRHLNHALSGALAAPPEPAG